MNLGLPSGSLGLGKLLDPLQERLAMALTSAVGFFPCDKVGRYCLGTLNPKSQTLNPNTPNPRPHSLNPEPSVLNTRPGLSVPKWCVVGFGWGLLAVLRRRLWDRTRLENDSCCLLSRTRHTVCRLNLTS